MEFEGLTIISYNVGGISLFDIHGLIETLEMEQPWGILLLQEFGSFKETPDDYIEHSVLRSSTSDVGFRNATVLTVHCSPSKPPRA